MKYILTNAKKEHIDLIKSYKLESIIAYANDLKQEELERIKDYVNNMVSKNLKDYKLILVNEEIAGCLLVKGHLDGVLLDEIFIEEKYRNKGIGTHLLKQIINNNIVYLWVYKNNKIAYSLYKKLGFEVIENDKDRYFMRYFNSIN